MDFGIPQWIVLAVAIERLLELSYAERNTRRLLAAGGTEHGVRHYPLMLGIHAGWLVMMFLAAEADRPVDWPWLIFYLVLQLGRIWVLVTLGRFWTTRIISLPGQPLINHGPYRWIRHPNYVIVALEIVTLPMAFGLWPFAIGFGLANAILLLYRIRIEDRALAGRRARDGRATTGATGATGI